MQPLVNPLDLSTRGPIPSSGSFALPQWNKSCRQTITGVWRQSNALRLAVTNQIKEHRFK
jgi:hypothetical protein